jgi:hypothetical protein
LVGQQPEVGIGDAGEANYLEIVDPDCGRSEMREWLLVGLLTAYAFLSGSCANPEPAKPSGPQIMNGFYIEKSPKPASQRPKPTDTTTASQPAVQPIAAPAAAVSEPQPLPAQPAPAPIVPVAPPPASPAPSDASQFIEPPSK